MKKLTALTLSLSLVATSLQAQWIKTSIQWMSVETVSILWGYSHDPYVRDNMSMKTFKSHFTMNPQPNANEWYFDYVGHPLKDGTTYLLMRNQGASWKSAWAFSTIHAIGYEYLFEGTYVVPDTKDLLTGLVSGVIVGETFYWLTKQMEKGGLNNIEKVLTVILNPTKLLF